MPANDLYYESVFQQTFNPSRNKRLVVQELDITFRQLGIEIVE